MEFLVKKSVFFLKNLKIHEKTDKFRMNLRGYPTISKHLHEHNINNPGTDTWKHANAGADVVIGVTQSELVKFSRENNLTKALDELADMGVDFGVIEGFKESKLPKIALGNVEAINILKRLNKPERADIEDIINIILEQPEYHTLNSLLAKIRKSRDIDKSGAIGTFTGIVRATEKETRTEFLEFEEYSDIARKKMNEICSELKQKDGIIDVLMHHKTGIILKGEDIVYIVVAATHREQLFPVLREAIERLKAQVPIWKKEHTQNGEFWVHDTNNI